MKLNEKGMRLMNRGFELWDEGAKLEQAEYGKDAECGWDVAEEHDLDKTVEDFVGLLLAGVGDHAYEDVLTWWHESDDDPIPYGLGRHVKYGELKEVLRSCYEAEEEIVLKISRIKIKSETFCTPWNGKLYCVDVCEDAEDRSAWLYRHDCGIKSLLWGESIKQNSRNKFLDMVFSSLPDYIDDYEKEFGEDEED